MYGYETYILIGQLARATACGGSIYGLPDKPEAPETAPKADRPHGASDPRKSDADVKLAQLYRLTGLKGTSVLSRADYHTGKKGEGRMVTARGRPTANVPSHLSGLEPNASLAVHQASDGTDMTVTGDEIRFLRRYREGMRGKAYAASMEREHAERTLAYWRAAFPWIPCDSHGKLWEGKRYNRADGIGERIYADGSMLSERKREYDAAQHSAESQTERDAEIARLAAESAADARAERTVRVRKAIESERKALRF